MPRTMSQVSSGGKIKSKQPGGHQESIESEPTKGYKSRKKATSSASRQKGESGDCKALDSFTLIDTAKVAAATSEAATGKDHHREPQAADPVRAGGGGTTAKVITKLTLPSDEFGDKFAASDCHQENEVNNNSIPASESQAISSSTVAFTSHMTNQTELTPLSLLTGLRMHTSYLKNQQQLQKQQGSGSIPTATACDDSGDPKKVPNKGEKQVQEPSGTPTPASFVESSQNLKQGTIGAHTSANSLPPRPYNPSYTSLFSHHFNSPASISSPLSALDKLESHKISSSSGSAPKQHMLSESSTIRQTASSTTTTSRGPLVKQQAITTTPRESSPRSLFLASTSSKSGQINTTTSDNQRWPSIFDNSTGRLREPSDYDDCLSAKSPVHRLVDGDADDIIDYDNDADGQDFNCVQEDNQGVSPDSYISSKTERNLTNNLRASDRSTLIVGRNSIGERRRPFASLSPEISYQQQHQLKQPHNQLNYHQTPKYPGSSSRLSQPSLSDRTARADSSLKVKIIQAQRQGGKKLQQQLPQAQHTRVMTNELSRPPSFNMTTCQQQQEHNMKMASCRKLNLLEQVAHLDCNCEICSKGRELAGIHNNDLFHHNSGSRSKLSNFNLNSQGEKNYPRTRFVHMVLKSIILVLCTLLLLLLLVGTILITHYLPQSMEKVMNVSRSFNVTIAGRR